MDWWERAYTGSPPWDIEVPQPEIVKLVKNNEVPKGRVLDIGCGLGDNSIFLAKNGFSVTCMDIAHLAIDKGKVKADKQKVKVDFRVGDVLKLDQYFDQGYFNAIVDSGLFHTLSDDERPIFAKQVRWVLADGGKYFMLCFSDKERGNEGPRRVSKKEIEVTFSNVLRIDYVKDAFFATKWGKEGAKAYLSSMTKIDHF
jgi:cyclopropane fatty-acyl-phospholipid synthase-like methyltransferase